MKYQQKERLAAMFAVHHQRLDKLTGEKIHLKYELKRHDPFIEDRLDISHAEKILEDLNDTSRIPAGVKPRSNPTNISNNLSTARLLLEKKDLKENLENKRHPKRERMYYNAVMFSRIDSNANLDNMKILPFTLNRKWPSWKENILKILTHNTDNLFSNTSKTNDDQNSRQEQYRKDTRKINRNVRLPSIIESDTHGYSGPIHCLSRARRRVSIHKVIKIQEALNKTQSKNEIKNLQREIRNLHLCSS